MSAVTTATVITPCRDAAGMIERTAKSIMEQTAVRSGRLKVQYLVCDGASTDGTPEIVRSICGDQAEVISEPDSGMYDALAKGLARATGQLVSYCNAGDYYAPHALDVAADVLEQTPVAWFVGLSVWYRDDGAVTGVDFPRRARERFLRKGLLYWPPRFPFGIQQESSFWRRELLATVDMERLRTFRLAGDSYLWTCFSQQAPLYLVDSYLGGFTVHAGQQSENWAGYQREMLSLRRPPTPSDHALAFWDRFDYRYLPMPTRRRLRRDRLIRFDPASGRWGAGS